ncbi:MAG TPA: hypothetical protein VLL25_13300 [Acidimicrobiales bacterium]|nr:hypothetical protein [Acidimicrobiales bacterium]
MIERAPTTADPDFPGYELDPYGDVLAKIHVVHLEDWWWLLRRVADWLLHPSEETIEDYARCGGPGAPAFDDVVYTLGHMASYLRTLVDGAPR